VNIGDPQIKVEDSPNIGPVIIEIGLAPAIPEVPVVEPERKEAPQIAALPEDNRLTDISEKMDRLLDYAWSIEALIEEIRDHFLSPPWYVSLWRWLKGKF